MSLKNAWVTYSMQRLPASIRPGASQFKESATLGWKNTNTLSLDVIHLQSVCPRLGQTPSYPISSRCRHLRESGLQRLNLNKKFTNTVFLSRSRPHPKEVAQVGLLL